MAFEAVFLPFKPSAWKNDDTGCENIMIGSHILFANIFESFTSEAVVRSLKAMGYRVEEKDYYTPKDPYNDDRLYEMVKKTILTGRFDVVFTVNIWPIVARVCHDCDIIYIAWSYDSPQNLPSNRDLNYETNFLFLFDRAEVEIYRREGIDRVYHLPLAADVKRWDAVRKRLNDPRSRSSYKYEVSLLGSLYESTLPALLAGMGEYNQGYIKAVIEAQKRIYGYFLIDDILTDELMASINEDFAKTRVSLSTGRDDSDENCVTIRQLAYSMSSYITYIERLSLLRLLGSRCDMHLFSSGIKEETKPLLKNITIHSWVSYEEGMPAVFMQSKVNLNPSLKIIRSGISLRCMDIMGCGGFLLSSYQPELAEFFVPDEELVLYESMEDAVEKALFYIKNDTVRERIAQKGYEKTKALFSYERQLGRLFETVRGSGLQ